MITKVVSRAQMSVINRGVNKMMKMNFAKKSFKFYYVFSTIAESLNIAMRFNPDVKE